MTPPTEGGDLDVFRRVQDWVAAEVDQQNAELEEQCAEAIWLQAPHALDRLRIIHCSGQRSVASAWHHPTEVEA